jgi:hypothetical protein
MFHAMEGYIFASVLGINMGYYHIKLNADAQKIFKFYFHEKWENTNTNNYQWVSRLSGSQCISKCHV